MTGRLVGELTATYTDPAEFSKTLTDCIAAPVIDVISHDEDELTLTVMLDVPI